MMKRKSKTVVPLTELEILTYHIKIKDLESHIQREEAVSVLQRIKTEKCQNNSKLLRQVIDSQAKYLKSVINSKKNEILELNARRVGLCQETDCAHRDFLNQKIQLVKTSEEEKQRIVSELSEINERIKTLEEFRSEKDSLSSECKEIEDRLKSSDDRFKIQCDKLFKQKEDKCKLFNSLRKLIKDQGNQHRKQILENQSPTLSLALSRKKEIENTIGLLQAMESDVQSENSNALEKIKAAEKSLKEARIEQRSLLSVGLEYSEHPTAHTCAPYCNPKLDFYFYGYSDLSESTFYVFICVILLSFMVIDFIKFVYATVL